MTAQIAHPSAIRLYTPEEYAAGFKVVRGSKYYGEYGTGCVVLRHGQVYVHLPRGGHAYVKRACQTFAAMQAELGITPIGLGNLAAYLCGAHPLNHQLTKESS